jgi:alkylation response protein AidB-like acyl-CoA dehydrogenase
MLTKHEPETHGTVARQVQHWLRDNWDPGLTVRQWWARLADSGWGFPTWPTDWFGRGLTSAEGAKVRREMIRAGVLGPPTGVGPSMASGVLFVHGSEEQKQRWLPVIARGEEKWCQFFSEPGAGSDLASVQTRAVFDGQGWVVNGQKVWNSGTTLADRGLLVARSDLDVPKHRGISFFVIDMDQPGIEVRPIRQMNGRSEFCEAFFTNARVSDADMIGGINRGFGVAMTTLNNERAHFAGGGDDELKEAIAGARGGDLDRTVADVLADDREDWDSANKLPISSTEGMVALARRFGRHRDPVIRQRIAQLHTLTETHRFTALRAEAAASSGREPGPETSVGYLGAVAIARLCRDLAAAIAGPSAMLSDVGAPFDEAVAMNVTTAPCHGIQGGSEQIQRNVIGERILGLPKEPQVDRDLPFRLLKVGTQRS